MAAFSFISLGRLGAACNFRAFVSDLNFFISFVGRVHYSKMGESRWSIRGVCVFNSLVTRRRTASINATNIGYCLGKWARTIIGGMGCSATGLAHQGTERIDIQTDRKLDVQTNIVTKERNNQKKMYNRHRFDAK